MLRALFELILTVLVVVIARAILTSILRSLARTSSTGFRQQGTGSIRDQSSPTSSQKTSGELHRDPVCGTYVAESTPFRRETGGQRFYYCSDACREKHTLVAR